MVWAVLQGCIGNSGTPGRIWRRGHAFYRYAHRGEWRGCRVVVTCARPFDDHCVVGRVPRQPRAGKPQNTPLVHRCRAVGFLRAGDFLVRYPLCAGCPRASGRSRRRLHAAEVAAAKGVTLKAVVKRWSPGCGRCSVERTGAELRVVDSHQRTVACLFCHRGTLSYRIRSFRDRDTHANGQSVPRDGHSGNS